MQMSFSINAAGARFAGAAVATAPIRTSAPAESDRRWPAILRTLSSLRRRGRGSVRIVDTRCGGGALLLAAARRARALGFVAIEALGVDRDAALIARAQADGRRLADPAIGVRFDIGEAGPTQRAETDFPADLLLCDADDVDELTPKAATIVLPADAVR